MSCSPCNSASGPGGPQPARPMARAAIQTSGRRRILELAEPHAFSPLTPALSPLRGEGVAALALGSEPAPRRFRHVSPAERQGKRIAADAFVLASPSVAPPLHSKGSGWGRGVRRSVVPALHAN